LTDHVQVAVVGAGQAGLSVSRELAGQGLEPVVLERGLVGQTWRDRWDSFCLVTPNWSVQLPGGVYEGPEPDGYMSRDELVAYFEGYAEDVPVREGVEVVGMDGLTLRTTEGDIEAGPGADRRQRPDGVPARRGASPGGS
jgi:putative flavoprotein involved in K+ transport